MKDQKKPLAMKTCSRGHRYRGGSHCPICWPGGVDRKPSKARAKKARS